MTKELKNKGSEMTARIRILHVLSDKDKRVRPLENLVAGLDSKIFSQVICYLSGDPGKQSQLEEWGYDGICLASSKKKSKANNGI